MTDTVIEFDKGKQYSVLAMNTLAFTVNFAVWTMFAVIGIKIKDELGLNETEFGFWLPLPSSPALWCGCLLACSPTGMAGASFISFR